MLDQIYLFLQSFIEVTFIRPQLCARDSALGFGTKMVLAIEALIVNREDRCKQIIIIQSDKCTA